MTDIPPNDLSPSSVGESHTMSQEDKKRRLAYFDRHLAVSKNTAGQSTQDANAGGSDEPTSARPVKVWTGADPIVDLPDYKQGFDPKSRLTSKDWSKYGTGHTTTTAPAAPTKDEQRRTAAADSTEGDSK